MRFQGRTALITGSGTGIGRAIARAFAEEGASVIILGRRKEPLEEAAAMLRGIIEQNGSGASVRVFSGVDVSDEPAMTGMFDRLESDGVRIDCMVNNAGVSGPVRCFSGAGMDEFAGTVAIHLTGTFWGSVQALRVMGEGGRIITISTFFTEERPLEQRPYRFRSPYTAAQGAKNRLAEAMSWELVGRGVASIATNPGPVHSDRIYKTVYPKAAAEFMRVSGFGGMDPAQTAAASAELLGLLGEDEGAAREGVAAAAQKLGADESVLSGLLEKIRTIAEKVQSNTSRMIANREFLSQGQVAESVLNLCDEKMAAILNGKTVPGDRVFYPVRPHVGGAAPGAHRPDLGGRAVVITVDATDESDGRRAGFLASHAEECGGKAVCLVSGSSPEPVRSGIASRFHSHEVDLSSAEEVARWLATARSKFGGIAAVVHLTGGVPDVGNYTDLGRAEWEGLVSKFILTPANVVQRALDSLVPGGGEDPRLYKGASGSVMVVGPDLPAGRIDGAQRARIEVFRGALRPFVATVNQELADVLKSDVRVFAVLPGSVAGAEPDDSGVAGVLDFMASGGAASSSEVIFCPDESRT